MAYIVGLLSSEEAQELKRRGWDLEAAPRELRAKLPGKRTYMVWVDTDMFAVMDGPDWDKGPPVVGSEDDDNWDTNTKAARRRGMA